MDQFTWPLTTDQEIEGIVSKHRDDTDQATVDALVEAARQAGGRDKVTVVLVSAPDESTEGTGRRRVSDRVMRQRAWSLGIGVVAVCLLGWVAYRLLGGP